MGMNYYLRRNYCPCCGHCREEKHIGKASFGWRWVARVYDGINTFEDYKKFLNTGTIYDEENRIVSLDEILQIIASRQNDKKHEPFDQGGEWVECDWAKYDFC